MVGPPGRVAGSAVPLRPELTQKPVPDGHVLQAVVDCPIDTQLLLLPDQPQDSPDAFRDVEVLSPAALLPGVHSQQLQSVGGPRIT